MKLRKDFLKVTHIEGFVWLLSTMPHYVSDARYAHSTYEIKRKEIRGEYAGKITEWFQKNARSFDAKKLNKCLLSSWYFSHTSYFCILYI